MEIEMELEHAIRLARNAHQGQTDKAGRPYIEHCLRVMARGETLDEMIVGALHDVLEDCPGWTPARLIANGLTSDCLVAVMALTRGSEDYETFIDRVAVNPLARAVKLNDLADNMDLSRLGELTDADHARQAKYSLAVERLTTMKILAA